MVVWIILLAAAVIHEGQCQYSDNTPPTMWVDREWHLSANEPVGSVVIRVHASDNENDTLEFGLEQVHTLNRGPNGPGSVPLPFTIDSIRGVVYTNQSLKNLTGQSMFLYVTVSDGKLTVKNEVRVTISDNPVGSYAPVNRPPYPKIPVFGAHPSPPLPPGFQHPGLSTSRPKKIHLQPVNGSRVTVGYTTHDVTIGTTTEDPKWNQIDSNFTLPQDIPVKSPADLTVTLVPVLSVCAIFLAVGVIAILFRKKIYLGRAKGSKDDMRKDASGGIVLQEDPSLAMQHWRGPRAFSNRYEPWEREGNQTQMGVQNGGAVVPSDHWEFPRHRLKVFNILGEGAFGQVWKCEALDIDNKEGVSVVAVKTLKENATEKERTDLISELQVMKSLEPHPNVVRLLGCCTEKEPFFVIMEYVSKGKLQSFLRSSRAERYYGNMHGKSKSLTSRDLTSFVYQVARGMEYLSSRGIIHRDLAARNVLITDDHTCKVADFGFARDVVATLVYERKSEGRLPIRWMAPESLYDNIFSVKSDVWSFGVLIWEVVTLGSTPYPGLSAAEVMRKVRDGHRLDKPEHCRRELYNIMYYCWDQEPKLRPTFRECVELLEKLLLTETDYIELERFPDHSYYNMLSLSDEKL